jgi:hypothetical protein
MVGKTPVTAVSVAALALASLTACQRSEIAPAWAEDSTYVYELDLESQAGAADIPAPMFSLDVTGKLRVSAQSGEGEVRRVTLSLQDLQVKSSSDAKLRADVFTAHLQRSYELELRGGLVQGLRIEPGTDYMAVAVMRTVASAFQLAQPPKAAQGPGYEAREFDSTGEYVARYERADAQHVHKQKLRYEDVLEVATRPSAGPKIDSETRAEVQSSSVDITLQGATPRNVSLSERILVPLMNSSKLAYDTKLSLELVGQEPARSSAKAAAELTYLPAGRAYAPTPKLGDLDAVRIGDLSFRDVIHNLEEIARKYDPGKLADGASGGAAAELAVERNRYFTALAAFYRQDASFIEQARALVRAGSPAANWLLSALGSSGTPAGQQALVETMHESNLSMPLRKAAGLSLLQANEPTVATARALEALLGDETWQKYAVFAVGIYARRMREVGQTAESERLSRLLLERLAEAREPDAIADVLGGLSNAAYGPSVKVMPRYLAHEDAVVRESAVQALRLVDTVEADRLLSNALAKDEAFKVRMVAADTARQRSEPRDALVDAVSAAATTDADARVRLMAVRALGAWLPKRPALTQVVQTVLDKDTDANVLLTAKALLSPPSK